jgi:hypothetical protein
VVPTIPCPAGEEQTKAMPPGTDPSVGDGAPSPLWQQVQTIGLAEIAMTILEARKTMPAATTAIVTREREGAGFRVCISLMEGADGAGEVVAVFVAHQVGKDLESAFGDKDVIILR